MKTSRSALPLARRSVAILALFAGLFLLATQPARAAETAAWRPHGIVSGLWVDERPVANSGFEEVRVSTLRPESVQQLCDAIFARNNTDPKLQGRLREHEVLRETPTERWTYERIKVPAVTDRDYVVHMKVDEAPATGRCAVSFQSENDPAKPPVKDAVRIRAIRGQWNVLPTPDGKVSVTYQMFTDPGGNIPAMFAKGPLRDAAVEFFKTVMQRAQMTEEASR